MPDRRLVSILKRLRGRLKAPARWDEQEHPRASDGRFGNTPGTHTGGGPGYDPDYNGPDEGTKPKPSIPQSAISVVGPSIPQAAISVVPGGIPQDVISVIQTPLKQTQGYRDYKVARKKVSKLRRQLARAMPAEARVKLTAQYRAEKAKASEHSRAAFLQAHGLPPKAAAKVAFHQTSALSKGQEKSFATAKGFLGSVLGKAHARMQGVAVGGAPGGRSYYTNTKGIALDSTSDASIVVHEYGHHLERQKWVKDRLKAFDAKRFGNEQPTRLAQLFPDHGYGADEYGRKDQMDRLFGKGSESYYVGKAYSDGSGEILSMGMELLYKDAVGFAEADPEYFALVVGILKGEGVGGGKPRKNVGAVERAMDRGGGVRGRLVECRRRLVGLLERSVPVTVNDGGRPGVPGFRLGSQ
jgi:hypothetical protein